MRAILQILVILCLTPYIHAQIIPGEGDVLNYRLTGFSVPAEDKAISYTFYIAAYSITDGIETYTDITVQTSDSNRTVIMLPEFNKSYAWKVDYTNNKGKLIKSTPYYHFKTGNYVTIDTAAYRLKIIDTAAHHDDMFVIVDNISVIYDMLGNPVWYLPDVPLHAQKDMQLRCIKPTQTGTFTAVSDLEAFEFDYHGKIRWKAPNNGVVSGNEKEFYHHEFTKLSNGNYLVAGFQLTMEKAPAEYKIKPGMLENGKLEQRKDGLYRRTKSDNLIEYNVDKQVVWSWKSLDHFDISEFFRRSPKGVNIEKHLNSFYFDEKNKVIYTSYRNNNEIVKIEYPTGSIRARYGSKPTTAAVGKDERLFYGQHHVTVDKGLMYLFNNNTYNHYRPGHIADNISHVSIYKEDTIANTLNNVWDFPCDIDPQAEWFGNGGGSVALLPDSCLLVNMGSAGRIFIVSPGKKIVWNAIVQQIEGGKWANISIYRANFISRRELEQFIFN